jgi:uncharacterized protein (TIGR02001 family)
MKTLVSVLAMTLALPAFAQTDGPLSFNVSAVSDYRYRGISQTRLKPAVQGGLDYALPAGFYVGAWASTIKWIKDAGGDADAEVDVYGGYKTEVAPGLTLDVGLLQYVYPGHKLGISPDTLELYGALSFGPVTAKYSHGITNLFGFADSKDSSYLDVSASLEIGAGLTLAPHIGHQTVRRNAAASYTDYSLTLAKDFSGLVASAAVVGTDADRMAYANPVNAKFMGKTMLVVGLKKTF